MDKTTQRKIDDGKKPAAVLRFFRNKLPYNKCENLYFKGWMEGSVVVGLDGLYFNGDGDLEVINEEEFLNPPKTVVKRRRNKIPVNQVFNPIMDIDYDSLNKKIAEEEGEGSFDDMEEDNQSNDNDSQNHSEQQPQQQPQAPQTTDSSTLFGGFQFTPKFGEEAPQEKKEITIQPNPLASLQWPAPSSAFGTTPETTTQPEEKKMEEDKPEEKQEEKIEEQPTQEKQVEESYVPFKSSLVTSSQYPIDVKPDSLIGKFATQFP